MTKKVPNISKVKKQWPKLASVSIVAGLLLTVITFPIRTEDFYHYSCVQHDNQLELITSANCQTGRGLPLSYYASCPSNADCLHTLEFIPNHAFEDVVSWSTIMGITALILLKVKGDRKWLRP